MAFYNVVYNVTDSPIYKKGGKLENYAGHDITLAIAKDSKDFLDKYNEK